MILYLLKRYKAMASCKALLQFIVIMALFLALFLHHFLSLSYATTLYYDSRPIDIQRDEFNIPVIRAHSLEAALYAWGYVAAQDRLFQMGFRRYIGQGRLSELVGEKGIAMDKMMREINFYGDALKTQKAFKTQNITEYKTFQAYTKGINECVKNRRYMPMEYYLLGLQWSEWTVADSFLMFKLLKWSQSQNFMDEYLRSVLLKNNMTKEQIDTIMPYTPEKYLQGEFATQATIIKDEEFEKKFFSTMKELNIPTFKPVEVNQILKAGFYDYLEADGKGSNSWVVGGKYTESGHPLLVNDPHLDSALPGQWHQVKIQYLKGDQANTLSVAAIPGVPLWIGQSTYFSLAMTTTYSDSQDLYKQTLNQKNEYLHDGIWRPLKTRVEIIQVKGQKQPIRHFVSQTHHGPIIKNIGYRGSMYQIQGDNISLCWSGSTSLEYKGIKDFIHIAQIRDYDNLIKMLKEFSFAAPVMNMMYITADDHYGYLSVGPIPKRRHPHMGMYVKDGSKPENDWTGFVQPEERLHVDNNERGYIVTANNKPVGKNFQNGLMDITMYTGRGDRLQRIVQDRIASGKKFNKDFMKEMQLDTIDPYCQEIVNSFKLRIKSNRAKYNELFGVFEKFDCNFSSAATVPSIYLTFYQNVYEEVKPEPLKNKYALSVVYPFNQYVHKFIKEAETDAQIAVLQTAMKQALQQLKQYFGTKDHTQYLYGKLHRDWMKHRPFSESNLLKGLFQRYRDGFGNMHTPNVAVMSKFEEKDYRTDHRANIRTIISYHEGSQWIIDGGTSQSFYSKHYDDQNELFFQNKFLPMDLPPRVKQQNNDL